MKSITKKKDANKTCTQKVDKSSKNAIARMPQTHIQTRNKKCKVKEIHFLKSQRSIRKDQISMQSYSKPKECRSTKGRKIIPRRIRMRN
jgi:hypothetical protein